MKKKTKLKMSRVFNRKIEEITNLVNVYNNISNRSYVEIKLKVDLSEIETLQELDLFELMVSANSCTVLNLYFHNFISMENYHIADSISDILNILIGGRRAELKLGL